MRDYLQKLNKDGFVIIKDFLTADDLGLIENLSNELLASSSLESSDDINIDEGLSNYDELARSVKTTLSIRGSRGVDQNLLDFFNPDIWFLKKNKDAAKVIQKISNGLIQEILLSFNKMLKAKNMNLYCHQGVSKPRMHHIDSIRPYFKAFIALSDQTSEDCGPFALIPGSHKRKIFNYFMCLYNSKILHKKNGEVTDATFYSQSLLKPMYLSKGDLLLSNQSLVHGAMPAGKEGKRLTLVQTFDVK